MAVYLLLALFYLVSLLIAAFPAQIVSWHARMYRHNYPNKRALDLLDQLQMFDPLGKFLVGKASDYVMKGPEEPEAFPRMVWFIRLLGLIPLIGATLVLLYIFLVR